MTNVLPPAHWAADPSGRHELRYWDGARWTDHVSDRGTMSIDPIAGPSVADTAVSPEPVAPAPEPEPEPEPTFELLRAESATTIAPVSTVDAGTPGWAAPVDALRPPPPPPLSGTGFAGAGAPSSDDARWRSMNGLKTALVVLFACIAVVAVASLGVHLNRLSAADNFQHHPSFTTARDLRDADDTVDSVATFYLFLYVAIAACFIIWMFRAAKNMIALGRHGARYGPGWSIGGWFVPFANLVIPVRIVQGFWRASSPDTNRGTLWENRSGSALVGFWWAAHLVSNFAYYMWNDNKTLDDIRTSDTVSAIGAAAGAIAAALAIMVVVQLTRRFNDRRAEVPGL